MQIEYNGIKTPSWREATIGYLQAWPRKRTLDDREQIHQVTRAGLERGTARLRVRRAERSATMPLNMFTRQETNFRPV